jgi:hypothetical protein
MNLEILSQGKTESFIKLEVGNDEETDTDNHV